jgi:hypothetical protein
VKEVSGKIGAEVKAPGKLATALVKAINDLQTFINEHRLLGSSYKLRLKQVSGPRYWEPTDPRY